MPARSNEKSESEPEPPAAEPEADPSSGRRDAPDYDEFDMDCWEPSLADKLRNSRK